MAAHESKTHFAQSMRTAAVKYEEIICPTTEQAVRKKKTWLRLKLQLLLTVSSWNGGDGTVLGQPVSQGVVDVDVEAANQEEKR